MRLLIILHYSKLKLKWLDVRNIKLDMGIFVCKAMNQLLPGQISEIFLSNQVNGK